MTLRRRYFDGQVTSPAIAGEAVTEEKIADGAVTSAKIKDETIKSVDIGSGQVGTEDLADGAVTLAKMGSDVSIIPLQDGSVTNTKIADGAVSSGKLQDNAVVADKIATHAVTSTKLNDGAVTSSKIGTGEVTPAKLTAIDTPADGEVPTYNAAQLKIEWKPLPAGLTRPIDPPIDAAEIAGGAVTNEKIADRAVDWNKIALACVNHELLYNIAPPSDGQVLSFDSATGKFNWIDAPGGSKITLINPQTVFDETAMTDQAATLDVSAVVPATAIGVLVELHQDGMVPGWAQPSTQIQHPLGGVALTCYITGDAVGTLPMYNDNAGLVPVYSPQNIYLVINRVGVSTRVKVTVIGYVE